MTHFLFYRKCNSISFSSLYIILKEFVAIHCGFLVLRIFPPSFCNSYHIINLRVVTEFPFLLFVAQTLCVLAFGKTWGAFHSALVGALTAPVEINCGFSTEMFLHFISNQ